MKTIIFDTRTIKSVFETPEDSRMEAGYHPCLDWIAGFLPYLVKRDSSLLQTLEPVFSIHNLAYQGSSAASIFLKRISRSTLFFVGSGPASQHAENRIEFADTLSTVSPTYAKEIRLPSMAAVWRNCGGKTILWESSTE